MSFLKFSMAKVNVFLASRPVLRAKCISWLKAVGAYSLVRRVVNRFQRSAPVQIKKAPLNQQRLTSRGRGIYGRLKKAVGQTEAR
ncbi:hypothetical protein D3C77_419070 [compost metagenome]